MNIGQYIIDRAGMVFDAQLRVKKRLNSFINHKCSSGLKGLYYTYKRDRLAIKYGVEIGLCCNIAGSINFPHPRNILIGEGTTIGRNCTIFNNVTIGQKEGMYPLIGDNVIIHTGVVIIGGISVGNNVIIGANSLVNKNVEDNVIVAGCPAKVIKKIIGIEQ